jgi:hypothetical protein
VERQIEHLAFAPATMSNVQHPTYFLAPNWSFRPGGKIAIGNIVRHPLKPHMVLTKPDPAMPAPETETTTETNWRLSVETATNLSLSLWGAFLQVFRANISANRERSNTSNFTMTSLDTISFSENPSSDDIKKRCNDPRVREYMRLDSTLCSPVYMVTGIKIAKDFKLEGEKSATNGIEGEVGGLVSPDISLGTGAGVSKTRRIVDSFEAGGDVVFAYQLMKIKPKGWSKDKKFETSEYQHRQAFLEGGKSEVKVDDVEGELETVTPEDFKDLPKAQMETIGEVFVGYELPKPTK